MNSFAEYHEQRLLRRSIVVTAISALIGVGMGLGFNSKSILFDGIYEIIDAAMTAIALATARLIARGEDQRFQYGYWHLEPMLAFLNGLVLLVACVYGVVDGINGVLSGGREVQFGAGLAYSALSALLSFGFYIHIRENARTLGSQLLALDARAWLMGGVLSSGLFVSFAIGSAIAGTDAARYAPYIDPAILIVVALCLAPFPFLTVVRAAREILQIAPAELDARVRRVAEEMAARHGFVEARSHVVSVGRVQFIEIGFVAASREAQTSYAALDDIRQEIADAMGGLKRGHWLTVDFTADPDWI